MVPPGPTPRRGEGDARRRGPLALTPGDPAGIGPEITAKALAERRSAGDPVDAVVVGSLSALRPWAERHGLALLPVDELRAHPGPEIPVLDPGDTAEPVEVASLRLAVRSCVDGTARALVTGPIHKERLAAAGFRHPGHTTFLGELCGVERPVMAFAGGELKVALVTAHLPLAEVPAAITTEAVLHTVRVAATALRDQLGLERCRLVVCGLNPHAGDGGLLGGEDMAHIAPAVAAARAEGLDVRGPMAAESAFLKARSGFADLVVAMYHDQGLAPLKVVDFGRSVNWTLGLPIVRTSVDHGTADDIAGHGAAHPGSMLAAIAWAEKLTASS